MTTAIRFARGRNKWDAKPTNHVVEDFDAFEEAVLKDRARKKDSQYICAEMRPDSSGKPHRLADLAGSRRILAFDIDAVHPAEVFPRLLGRFEGWRGFAYTTRRHTKDAPRFRVFLELNREVDRVEGQRLGLAVQRQVMAEMGGNASIKFDESVYRAEQPCFLPPVDSSTYHFGGAPVAVDELLANAPELPQRRSAEERATAAERADPVVAELDRLGLILRRIQPGKLAVSCPRDEEHSEETSDSSTVYFLPNYGGFKLGRFHCFHDHCKDRTQEDYLAALELVPREVWAAQRGEATRPVSQTAPAKPILRTAAELLKEDFQPVRWLVPDLLPEGLIVLAARPKVGKSWFGLDLAIRCATGGQFLGRPVPQGSVLYLALEDNDRRLHARLKKLTAPGAELSRLVYTTDWPKGAEGAAAIRDWIADHPDARLVVIDVFARLRAPTAGSRETLYTTDYADVAMLKPPADRPVTILLVHHTRKEGSDDPLDTISGTLGVGGAADGALILTRARGADEAVLHLIGRDIEEEGAFSVRFDRGSCRWLWMGQAWVVRVTAERREILEVVKKKELKPQDIASELGKDPGAVRRLLSSMVRDGQVARGKDSRYRPVDPFEAYLGPS